MLKQILILGLLGFFAVSTTAEARCRIRNTTGKSLTLRSGNTSNQRVGGNTTTTIDDGEITGRTDDGQSVGGYCEDGGSVEVRERGGSVYIVPAG